MKNILKQIENKNRITLCSFEELLIEQFSQILLNHFSLKSYPPKNILVINSEHWIKCKFKTFMSKLKTLKSGHPIRFINYKRFLENKEVLEDDTLYDLERYIYKYNIDIVYFNCFAIPFWVNEHLNVWTYNNNVNYINVYDDYLDNYDNDKYDDDKFDNIDLGSLPEFNLIQIDYFNKYNSLETKLIHDSDFLMN